MQRRQQSLIIDGPVGPLQAQLTEPDADKALNWCAVVCHPHPSYGGTMDNKVVTTVVRSLVDMGVPAIRFNFRGVGESAGVYDQGVGEQQDLSHVVDFMRKRYPGARLLLAGFSFGSNMVWQYTVHHEHADVNALVLVAPPVNRMTFNEYTLICPLWVIQGEQDEIVEPQAVYHWFEQQHAKHKQLLRLPLSSHFFHGQLVTLREQLIQQLQHHLSQH